METHPLCLLYSNNFCNKSLPSFSLPTTFEFLLDKLQVTSKETKEIQRLVVISNDAILVHSKTQENVLEQLKCVLLLLMKEKPFANLEKYTFLHLQSKIYGLC